MTYSEQFDVKLNGSEQTAGLKVLRRAAFACEKKKKKKKRVLHLKKIISSGSRVRLPIVLEGHRFHSQPN